MKTRLVYAATGLAAACVAALFFLAGILDFSPPERHSRHQFSSGGHMLAATLFEPVGVRAPPVVVIVHGDGPADRLHMEGYLPLIHALLDADIAVFTWDKPGIGESGGDWLAQSMRDRAEEAAAAMAYVRSLPGVAPEKVGFVGFSQAGWVIPLAAAQAEPAFSVLVGAAVNWKAQGRYYTRRRLELLDWAAEDIAAHIAAKAAEHDAFFAQTAAEAAADLPDGMTLPRFGFVQRNRDADARAALAEMPGPVLALWGADDLNVDPVSNAETYRRTLVPGPDRQIHILPGASHGLLDAGLYNYQLPDQWPLWAQMRFAGQGRRAYAEGALARLTGWIHEMTR